MMPTEYEELCDRTAINEGCRLTAYPDPLSGCDPWTIGYGATGPGISKGVVWTQDEADNRLSDDLPRYVAYARQSLAPGIFDTMTLARRIAVIDLNYNLGQEGWLAFTGTRSLISQAQTAKIKGDVLKAHVLYNAAADHLAQSAWYTQVGNRAKRNVAMIRNGALVKMNGAGEV